MTGATTEAAVYPAGPRAGLPSGTVTMLFAELDGTTALLTRVGASAYATVLREQRRIVHEAAGTFGGHEMDTEGEGAFVVFRTAADALAAAAQMQRETAAHPWPVPAGTDTQVRVRAGVDTGEPDRHEDGYIGLAVHHTARICAAAHGGQVLVGPSAWTLAGTALPAGVTAVDVGEHRLKDLPAPVRLHRLVVDGAPEVTAPPRGLGTPARLPQPNTPLVGRVAEVAMLAGSLSGIGDTPVRLVTLVGPGGVGKTRLAVEAAAAAAPRFAGGIHFADLSAVGTAAGAWSRLAEVLAVGDDGDVGPHAAVTRFVSGRHCLLVLDNLEQVDGAAELVAELVAASEQSVVLATSRQPVRLQAERVVPVEPLDEQAAVELFLQHARRVRPGLRLAEADLAAVAQVCRTLDRLPLALEIAAVRLRLLSPARLLAGLGGGLSLTSNESDRPERQRSLRDTIGWSYALLDPPAQRLLRAVSAAPGGADLTTVEALLGDANGADPFDVLAELVDASLLRMRDGADGEPRVHLLRLVAQFAAEALDEAAEGDEVRARLAARMAEVVSELGGQLQGGTQVHALDRLQAERDNIEAALEWSLAPDGPPPAPAQAAVGLRITSALGRYWEHHTRADTARRWLERAVELTGDDEQLQTAALEALQTLAGVLFRQGEAAASRDALEHTVAAWRERGDEAMLSAALAGLGLALRVLGDIDGARTALLESVQLARRTGGATRLAASLTDLGILETDTGEPARGAELFDEAIAVEEALGDAWGPAVSRANLAVALVEDARPAEALEVLGKVVPVLPRVGDAELEIVVLEGFASALVGVGDDTAAAQAIGAAERLRDDAGLPIAERDRADLDLLLAPGRDRLGAQPWAAAVRAGRGLDAPAALAAVSQPRRR